MTKNITQVNFENLFPQETEALIHAIERQIISAKANGDLQGFPSSREESQINNYEGYALAINAAWGEGKTTFLNLFCKHITDNNDQIIDPSAPADQPACKVKIIRFNAWANDFFDEPFIPLVGAFHDEFKVDQSFLYSAEKVAVFLAGAAAGALNAVSSGRLSNLIEGAADGAKIANRILKGSLSEFIKNYETNHTEIEEFKESLAELAGREILKIIIIDELDRCNPQFAVKLLERIKHIFSSPNTVFIFAVNMEQLAEVIKSLYGQGYDGLHYLSRFFNGDVFNYEPDYRNVGTLARSKYDLSSNVTTDICDYFSFSTREQIKFIRQCSNFKINDPAVAKHVDLPGGIHYDLAYFLIGLKIKNIVSYSKLLDEKENRKLLSDKIKNVHDYNGTLAQKNIYILQIFQESMDLFIHHLHLKPKNINPINPLTSASHQNSSNVVNQVFFCLFNCFCEGLPISSEGASSVRALEEIKSYKLTFSQLRTIMNLIDYGKSINITNN